MTRKRPFLWIFILFSAGIGLQNGFKAPLWALAILATGWAAAALFIPGRGRPVLICLAVDLVLLGGLYHESSRRFPANHINYHREILDGRDIALGGVVISEVKRRETPAGGRSTFTLDVREFDDGKMIRPAGGRVLVRLFRGGDLEYGDAVVLRGRLHRPYEFSHGGKFSYRRYLSRRGIVLIFSVARRNPVMVTSGGHGRALSFLAFRLRRKLERVLPRYLPSQEAGLMRAVVLGERSQIPDGINSLFQKTGTAHILAISGLHVGIVAVLVVLFMKLWPIGQRVRTVLAVLLLTGYAMMTGGRPSVVRAALMVSVFLSGFAVERETDGLNTLSLAGFLLLLHNPMNLYDPGFQLSFASVSAILLLYPVIWAEFRLWPLSRNSMALRFVFRSLAVSLAAWLGAAGLIAYYFEIVTPVAILANIIVIPLISVVVALGIGLVLVSGWPWLAGLFAVCIKIVLNLMVALIYALDKLPASCLPLGPLPWAAAAGYYAALIAGYWAPPVLWHRLEGKGDTRFWPFREGERQNQTN